MKKRTQYRFGERIRAVRERKGITLKQVAQKVQASESLISQIERNRVSPSVDTLIAIADVLEIDLEYLFEDFKKRRHVTVVSADKRIKHFIEGVTYHQLSVIPEPADEYSIEALLIEIPEKNQTGSNVYGHNGKELGILLEGEATLFYGNDSHHLKTGDSVSFSSAIPHILRNTGSSLLRAIWIVTPPRWFRKPISQEQPS